MVLAILLIGLALEEALNLYSLALLEEIEDCLVIVLDPTLEALDGRRGNLHATLLLGGLDGYTKASEAALLKVSYFCVLADKTYYCEIVTCAELLGDVLKDTKSNLEARIAAERGACEDKFRIAKNAKAAGMDATHDTVHEMAKDEARHCAGFMGLYKRYFGE